MTTRDPNGLGIEAKITYLMEQLHRIHDALQLHEWVRVYRPWQCKKQRVSHRERKASTPYHTESNCDCPGVYGLKCYCGEVVVDPPFALYEAAAQEFTGHY